MGLLSFAIIYLIYYVVSSFSKKEGFTQTQSQVSWSDNIKKIYLDAISRNPYVSIDPEASLVYVQTLYTEPEIRETLAFNNDAPESQFLLGGVTTRSGAVLKCINGKMTKVEFSDYKKKSATTIQNENIPSEIAGFKFLKNGSCNPCSALEKDYSCPFQFTEERKREKAVLGLGNYTGITSNDTTPIWKMLWGLPIDYNSLSVKTYLRSTNKT